MDFFDRFAEKCAELKIELQVPHGEGGYVSMKVSREDAEILLRYPDFDSMEADLAKVTLEKYRAYVRWIREGMRCMGTTKQGKQCSNRPVIGPSTSSVHDFVFGRDDRCSLHQEKSHPL